MKPVINVLGIYREERFSNHAIDADKKILNEVLNALENNLKYKVQIIKIQPENVAIRKIENNFDLVFSMAQDGEVLNLLDGLEKNGSIVLNSGESIRNCFRIRLSEKLSTANFLYPQFQIISTKTTAVKNNFNSQGYWVKRGDFHAIEDDDVKFINSLNDLPDILKNFEKRGVSRVILQENCEGELYKFYGVREKYFSVRYIGRTSNNRYQNIIGNANRDYDKNMIEQVSYKIAHLLGLDFFGGDFIVSETGEIHLIDFNDWPSFRTCVDEVAPIMANYALLKLTREKKYESYDNRAV
jgi:glutathione synthase/RimK-type ligase-like ATP-grasp enzyme